MANELRRPITRKFKKRKLYSFFRDNTWGTDLVDMQLIGKYTKIVRFLQCVLDIYRKYAWVVPLKDKKGITIANASQKILDEFGRKPKKI